jgi:hypothetical protein
VHYEAAPAGIVSAATTRKKEAQMAFIRIVQPPNVTADTYEKVNAELGVDRDPPPGLLLHCAGEVDGKWQIVDVWESREQARQFYEGRLPQVIEAVIGMAPPDPPASIEYELHTVITP